MISSRLRWFASKIKIHTKIILIALLSLLVPLARFTNPAVITLLVIVATMITAALFFRNRIKHLELTQRRFHEIQKNALDAIITIDSNGAVVEFNPSAEILFGYHQADVRGKDIANIIIPERLRKAHRKGFSRHLTTATTTIIGNRLELPAMRADGSEFLVELTVTALDIPEGKLFTAFLRDITERKQAEENLTRALADQAIIGTILGMSLQQIPYHDMLWHVLSFILTRGELGTEKGGAILLADPNTGMMTMAIQDRLDAATITACTKVPLPYGSTVCGNLTAYCIPIGDSAAPLGMMVLFPPDNRSITENDRNFLVAVADTLAGIISRHQAAARLRQLSQAVEQSPGSVVITDINACIQYVNRKFIEVTGYSFEEAIGKNPRFLKSGYTSPETYRELWETVAAGQTWHGEFHNRKKNGDHYWEQASISPIKEQGGTVTHYVAVKEDITLRKEYEERLLRQAHFDNLTNLPNRLLALDRFSQALAHARRQGRMAAVLFIDLDHFKRINDTLGHTVGDELLRQTAARLKGCTRESDTVARLGGDEFMIILFDIDGPTAAELVAGNILAVFTEPFIINHRELFIRASIGISIYPLDDIDAHNLLRNADAAMYLAKGEGRGTFRFFTPKLNEIAQENMRLEDGLRHALEHQELAVHYQPLVDIASGDIIGVEALLRWNNEKLGPIPPDRFIRVAEETGLIIPIGDWVLQTVCRQLKEWRMRGKSWFVSVNVSGRQFLPHRLAQTLSNALKTNKLSSNSLEIEITESILLKESDDLEETINELETLGVTFSMDDFGTGYSSLSYLRRFHFHTLKIDRSFVSNVTKNPQDANLVSSIITMGHSMNLKIIGEGIETPEQLAFLKAAGCDIGQGWLFGKAMSAEMIDTIEKPTRENSATCSG
ncbi:diguanylate cyclase [Gammaproteobacteria bacterium]